jgi:hypothetical protein
VEGNLVTVEMYNAKSRTTKFVPVFFDRQGEQFIPEPLRGHTQYLLNSEENYTNLYAFVTGQAGVTPGELGSLKTLVRNPVQPLRDRHEISVSSYATIRTNCIVPFSVEGVGTNIYLCDLLF